MVTQSKTTRKRAAPVVKMNGDGSFEVKKAPRSRKEVRPAVQLYTVDEARAILNVSRDKIYGLMRRGELDWRMIGQSRRIRSDDLARLIERVKGSGVDFDA